MKKKFFQPFRSPEWGLAAMLALLLSCQKNEPAPLPDDPEIRTEYSVLVMNAGNQYSGIAGSLTGLRKDEVTGLWTATQKVFQSANGMAIGSTLQNAALSKGKLYFALFDSNMLRMVDASTMKEIRSVTFPQEYGKPRYVVSDDEHVFVSMYGGYVLRAPLDLSEDFTAIKVGPNPEQMVLSGGWLYVANSDGMNYLNGYRDGMSVSRIRLSSFQVDATVPVGVNPIAVEADGQGGAWVLCMGDYGEVLPQIWHVNASGTADRTGIQATLMSASGGILYTVNAPYGAAEISYERYDARTLASLGRLSFEGIGAPVALKVEGDRIFLTSYHMVGGYASYSTDGYILISDLQGSPVTTLETGVGPCYVLCLDGGSR